MKLPKHAEKTLRSLGYQNVHDTWVKPCGHVFMRVSHYRKSHGEVPETGWYLDSYYIPGNGPSRSSGCIKLDQHSEDLHVQVSSAEAVQQINVGASRVCMDMRCEA